jgi:hypothetical protein
MLYVISIIYCFCIVVAWGIYNKTWIEPPASDSDACFFFAIRFFIGGLIWPLVAVWNFVIAPTFHLGEYIGEKRIDQAKAKELHRTEQELLQKKILLELKAAEKELESDFEFMENKIPVIGKMT